MDDLDGIWYRLPEDYDPNALVTGRPGTEPLESRTIIVPDVWTHEAAWELTDRLPERDRARAQRAFEGLVLDPRAPAYFTASSRSGYLLLDGADIDSLSSLNDLFYIPVVGSYGRPTEILNASRRFASSLGDEAALFALANEVLYSDVWADERSIPLGHLDA